MKDQIKYAIQELTNSGFKLIPKENGREGVDFIVKTDNGNTHELYLQAIDVEKIKSISILKSALGNPKDNLWIALVLSMDDIDMLYLIPSNQLAKPDDYIFFDSNQGELLSHFSSWIIKIFSKGIKDVLNEYQFLNQVKNLI
jgi:hypothetical protein